MNNDQVKLNDAIKLIYYAIEQFKYIFDADKQNFLAEEAHNELKEGIEKIMIA